MASDSDEYMFDAESDGGDDAFDSDEGENYEAPVKTASKKGSTNKSPVLAASNSNAVAKKTGAKKTIEDIYQKKTQREHILLRPDTYSKSM